MANIQNFKDWLKRDFSSKDVVHENDSQSSDEYRVYLYTKTNRYSIVARRVKNGKERIDDGYLGCIASSRKPRAGENWTRGNDLPDGALTEATWQRILAGIVRYELQRIHRKDLDTMKIIDEGVAA